jgi:hypothetical protein
MTMPPAMPGKLNPIRPSGDPPRFSLEESADLRDRVHVLLVTSDCALRTEKLRRTDDKIDSRFSNRALRVSQR